MERVKVALRVRPLLPSEIERGEDVSIKVLSSTQLQVVTHAARTAQNQMHTFDVDHCFGPDVDQSGVFSATGVPALCDAVFAGRAGTVMCFGQTGSGKTHTMSGHAEDDAGPTSEDGLQYAAAKHIAAMRDEIIAASPQTSVTLRASYVELFNEHINDLLNGTEGLKCRWSRKANSFFVEDLMLVECRSVEELLLVLREGQSHRKRAGHLLNADSSRSHVLFTVYVEIREGDRPARHGKLTCVDLAGSERLRDTGSQGDDSKSINRSLFALGNVVERLSKGHTGHIPYRSSVLTQLLMDSLDGGCLTLLIACVTPSSRFVEESLRTIYFAQRTRNICARPVERINASEQELYQLREEVRRLRAENAELRKELEAKNRRGGAQHVIQSIGAPHTIQSSGAPHTIQSSGTPHTIQSSGTPHTIQSSGIPHTIQSSGAPHTIQSSGTPHTIQSSGIPHTIQSSGAPHTIQSSGTPHTIQSSGAPHTIQSSGTPHTIQNSGTPHSIRSSGTPHTIQSSGTPHTIQSSGTPNRILSSGRIRRANSSGGTVVNSALDILDRLPNTIDGFGAGRGRLLPLGAPVYGFHAVQQPKKLFGT